MTIPLWYPPAIKKNISPGSNDPYIVPVQGILHVAVSDLATLFAWFNGPSGGIESHIYIRKDGTVEQYRAFNREADAQLGGNSWIVRAGTTREARYGSISVETQGFGSGSWTAAQQKAIKAFVLWAHTNLGIPLKVCATPRPTEAAGGGWGYHSLFTAWNSLKKTCPGANRIAWFHGVLVPWMLLQRPPKPAPTSLPVLAPFPEESDVPMQRYTANDGRGEFVVTAQGAVHLKNPTHLALLKAEGRVSAAPKTITVAQLDALLEQE